MTARATALPMIPLQGGVKPARDDRGELCAIAEEHVALRRVAALAAQGAPPPAVFTAVAAQAGWLLSADATMLGRYAPDGAVTSVGAWSRTGPVSPIPPPGTSSHVRAPVRIRGRPWGVLIAELPADSVPPPGSGH
jgi:hypothetical protein